MDPWVPGPQARIDFQCVEQAKGGQGNLRMSRGDAEGYKGILGGASPPIFLSWFPQSAPPTFPPSPIFPGVFKAITYDFTTIRSSRVVA